MAGPASQTHVSNKAKIARRVIEVLEYFDDAHPQATVMDIVRRFDRPQSSTSELLSSLVELGILRKDHAARTYHPTPRAALIGTAGQPRFVRDGRIVRLIDALIERTGYSVALTAMVGLDSQIVHWRHAPLAMASTRELASGMKDPVQQSAAGLLMLSTFQKPRREGMLRRLNSEAPDHRKFHVPDLLAEIEAAADRRYVVGQVGFDTNACGFSALMPRQPDGRPMAVSLVFAKEELVNSAAMLQAISETMREFLPDECQTGHIEMMHWAA